MKRLLYIICLLSIVGCSCNERTEELARNFVDMRFVPCSILTIKKIENYEIGYQKKSDLSKGYSYPNNYVIGVLDESNKEYKYITSVENISPIEDFNYIKSILTQFESDSTQIRQMKLEDETILGAMIYRKDKANSSEMNEWLMWKWVETRKGLFEFDTERLMNKNTFK